VTRCDPFKQEGPLFEDQTLLEALTSAEEDGWFEGLVLRGWWMGDVLSVDLFVEDRAMSPSWKRWSLVSWASSP